MCDLCSFRLKVDTVSFSLQVRVNDSFWISFRVRVKIKETKTIFNLQNIPATFNLLDVYKIHSYIVIT